MAFITITSASKQKAQILNPIAGWMSLTPAQQTLMKTEKNGVVRIKDGKRIVDTYSWQHDDKLLPDNHELVIYEMHVADFSGGEDDADKRGKYVDAIAKLDYLSKLGTNAIELMPVNEYPGDYT